MKMFFIVTNGFLMKSKKALKGELIQIWGKHNVVIFFKVDKYLNK